MLAQLANTIYSLNMSYLKAEGGPHEARRTGTTESPPPHKVYVPESTSYIINLYRSMKLLVAFCASDFLAGVF
jgi:hypothetical protein